MGFNFHQVKKTTFLFQDLKISYNLVINNKNIQMYSNLTLQMIALSHGIINFSFQYNKKSKI